MNRKIFIQATTALASFLLSFSATGRLSEPFQVLYGSVRACGQDVPAGTQVIAQRQGEPERAALFVVAAPGELYALDLPLDSLEPRSAGGLRPGDVAEIFVRNHGVPGCSELAATVTVGQPGTFRRLNLDPAESAITASLSLGDVAILEGDSGNSPAMFTLTLSEASEQTVVVNWISDTSNPAATATPNVDYTTASGTANINPGDLTTTFSLLVAGDPTPEPDEAFFVKIVSATNANVLDPLGKGTILDDDTPPTLAVGDVTITEPLSGSVLANFNISLSHPWDVPVSVFYATAAGTATANSDYLSISGTAVIPPGQLSAAVAVEVLWDPEDEDDETFFLDLSSPIGATLLDNQGQATIIDTIQFLFYIEKQQNGVGPVDGLLGSWTVAVSPDGATVYAAARASDSILLFGRNPASGQLSFLTRYQNGSGGITGLDGVEALLVTAKTVYAAGNNDNAIAVFTRNEANGNLTFLEAEVDGVNDPSDAGGTVNGLRGASGISLSPDGDHLYATGSADNAVATFVRNHDAASPNFGKLSFLEVEIDGVNDPSDLGGQVNGLAGASSVLVSLDGRFVFVTGFLDDAVATFARESDAATGARGRLSYLEMARDGVGGITALAGPVASALSPDGKHLYVAAQGEHALNVFTLGSDGHLSLLESKRDGTPDAEELLGIADVAVSTDGKVVFTSAYLDNAVTAFRRHEDPADPDFGRLATLEVKSDGVGGVTGIAGALGIACSSDDGSLYVAGNGANAVAVFARDLQMPSPPTLSSSHQVGVWSNHPQVLVSWSGATDTGGGSGVKGYSLVFDQLEGTLPNTTIEVWHTLDPHTASQSLADGLQHRFHLLTCDWSDNCTAPQHLGPFWIDTTSPGPASEVQSVSHTPGVPDPFNPVISMIWTAALDPGAVASGVEGYAYRFDWLSGAECDPVADSRTTATSAGSIPLVDGTWYFHLCAIDRAGNGSPSVTVGPYLLGDDVLPPQVLDLGSVPRPETSIFSPWVAPTQLRFLFDEVLLDPPGDFDPADVSNPANYLLVEAGANGTLETGGCGPIGGDDQGVVISEVVWDAATIVSTLKINAGVPLPLGTYRLFGCASLRDLLSNLLDGNGDGTGGDDFLRTFEILGENFLLNPNFDNDVAEWSASQTPDWQPEDSDFFATSGSLGMINSVGPDTSLAISQCVSLATVPEGTLFEVANRVRLAKSTPGDPEASSSVSFFALAGCLGSQVGELESGVLRGDTGGVWKFQDLFGTIPAGANSALVAFAARVGPEPDFGFEVDFDSLRFTVPAPPTVIFLDGFESGNTSAWGQTVP